MKHERTGSGGTITLAPGEVWIVDQQCMILHQGYLADWVGYFAGDKFFFEDRPGTTTTFDIDYGDDLGPENGTSPKA